RDLQRERRGARGPRPEPRGAAHVGEGEAAPRPCRGALPGELLEGGDAALHGLPREGDRDAGGGRAMSAPDPQALAAAMPFAVALGAQVTAATPEGVRGRRTCGPGRRPSGGALHGGAIMALADTLGA